MIGEIGALGGGILPNLPGQAKQHTGSCAAGVVLYAGLALCIFLMLRIVSRPWTRTWAGVGGRALSAPEHSYPVALHSTIEANVPVMEGYG